MLETTVNWKSGNFKELAENISKVINQPDNVIQIKELLEKYNSENEIDNVSLSLINIICYLLNKDISALLSEYESLQNVIASEDVDEIPYLFNLIWLDVQLSLPKAQNPVARVCFKNYKANINSLRKINPGLAELVQKTSVPGHLRVINYWNGLHYFDVNRSVILNTSKGMLDPLGNLRTESRAIVITSIYTCQEIIKCLQNQFEGIHGMSRMHYLLEEEPANIRALFEIYDFSKYIESDELAIFSGPKCKEQFQEKLETSLYPSPALVIGNSSLVNEITDKVRERVNSQELKESVFGYYQSDELKDRLQKIAKGEILPRIFISTCRWTTFLKYCASDFDRSFSALGCETKFLIELTDTQKLTAEIQMKQIMEFKPDMYFMVSHARTSVPFLPFELPIVCYLQDRCGPLLQCDDLSEQISERDIFICQARHFYSFLEGRNVNRGQYFVMPVPVDHEQIKPLDNIPEDSDRYKSDICFVKHVLGPIDQIWDDFKRQLLNIEGIKSEEVKAVLRERIDNLFKMSYTTGPGHITEQYVMDFFKEIYTAFAVNEQNIDLLAYNAATNFIVTVATTTWRHQFIERLAREDFDLALFGGNWDKTEPHVARFARGALVGKEQLRLAYGLSKINLHINNVTTMHQRLVECAFAKSFVIVAGIPEEVDWEPASYYFEPGKELIIADNPEHMVELCRYYLDKDDLRAEIAQNMYDKALESFTLEKASLTVLNNYRNRLAEILDRGKH